MSKSRVLYEDADVVVVDKPAGINVHAGHGRQGEETLADQVQRHVGSQVYPVHRLDRDTSGVIMFAKTEPAKLYLQKQFQNRSVAKTYLALVEGRPQHEQAILDLPIGRHNKNPLKRAVVGSGKQAVTAYKIVKAYSGKTLLEVHPQSGRTHQIRVHLAHLGNPVVGDSVYGRTDAGLGRQWLHAAKLKIKLPKGQSIEVAAPLAADLENYLSKL